MMSHITRRGRRGRGALRGRRFSCKVGTVRRPLSNALSSRSKSTFSLWFTMQAQSTSWGEWMGAWKSGSEVDKEAERIDRQKAAGIGQLKDLNVLIIGCRGVGTETAKNLILSNVGAVGVYDDVICCSRDMGANCYISSEAVSASHSRAIAVLPHLKSLNPFCKVDVFPSIDTAEICTRNFLGTKKPISSLILTVFLPKAEVIRINDSCRKADVAFIFSVNTGVTSLIFSDFGPKHTVTDKNGTPVQDIPICGVEIMKLPSNLKISGLKEGDEVVILTIPKRVTNPVDGGAWPDSGSQIQFDDFSSVLCRPGLRFNVEPVEIVIAGTDGAEQESNKAEFQQMLTSTTCFAVADMLFKKFKMYQTEHQAAGTDKTMPTRTIKLFTRIAVILPGQNASEYSDYMAAFKSWVNGGFMKQVLPEVQMSFNNFSDSIERTPNPLCLMEERTELGLGIDALLAVEAVFSFHASNGRWPTLGSVDDSKVISEIAEGISKARAFSSNSSDLCYAQKVEFGFPTGERRDVDKPRVQQFARFFEAELVGFCSFLGGVVAQEAMKKTGKFTPISGWLIHEDYDLVRAVDVPTMRAPLFGSRFDYQISVLGKDFQKRIGSQKVFLVGCGALGCEYMKALALMGAGSGHGGKVTVVDMDTIEVSNLSRQFLFREEDVKNFKSTTAARVVKSWVPSMNVEALQARVGLGSEDFFNDDFWEEIDVCWNALDNIQGRKYTANRCLMYGKPLLESGTLGTKNNSEVAIPFVTQSYADGRESDAQENAIAMCTLRSFPYLPLHCIEMAKQQYFSELFQFGPQLYETFRQDQSEFFEQIEQMQDVKERLKFLQYVKSHVQKQQSGSIDFRVCVHMAFDAMTNYFRDSIMNLIHMADAAERGGKPFWTGSKRKPRSLEWDACARDPQQRAIAMEFLYAASNMNAFVWGVHPIRSRKDFEECVASLKLEQKAWTLSTDSVVLEPGTEADPLESGESSVQSQIDSISGELYSVDVSSLISARPHDFEKDDDSNFHVDFLTVATNARAWNYNIKQSSRHEVKVTAGKIIPALATTTSAVCGMIDIEFCKLVLGLQHSLGSSPFANYNMDLAVPTFNAFRPAKAIQFKSPLGPSCPWDIMSIPETEAPTLEALINVLTRRYGHKVQRLSAHLGVQDVIGKNLYVASNRDMLDWSLSVSEDGRSIVTGGKILEQHKSRTGLIDNIKKFASTNPEGNTYKQLLEIFKTEQKCIDTVKRNFLTEMSSSVKHVYAAKCRPSDKDEPKPSPDAEEIFDRALARRGNLFLQVDLLYEPTITSGTIVAISGSGTKRNPWSAKIAVPSTAGIVAGMMLSATDGTGSIFGQTKCGDPESRQVSSPESVVVTSVEHDTSITYEVVGGTTGDVFEDQIPVLGSITNIVGYYEDPLPAIKYILMPGSS